MFETTKVTYAGLTHTCGDPGCHVPGFIKSLNDAANQYLGHIPEHTHPPGTPIGDQVQAEHTHKPHLTIVED